MVEFSEVFHLLWFLWTGAAVIVWVFGLCGPETMYRWLMSIILWLLILPTEKKKERLVVEVAA
jgi:hypothetical protein